MREEIVQDLPDLLPPDLDAAGPGGRRVRLRITVGPEGVVVLGDAARPEELEALLRALHPDVMQRTLCG